jgi:hypothetical protein
MARTRALTKKPIIMPTMTPTGKPTAANTRTNYEAHQVSNEAPQQLPLHPSMLQLWLLLTHHPRRKQTPSLE